ncbi:MAG: hypothetical protein N2652_11600 [Kiritimatiellae bacterium]|nr:hypothetical protein [Kiritimatiellia bacterium]
MRWDLGLARDSVVMIVSNGLAGLLFLAVHMVAGRWMAPTEYAAFASLLGLLWIVLVPSAALQVAVARYASEYCHARDDAMWGGLVGSVVRLVTAGGALLAAGWCVAATPLQVWLRAPTVGAVRWVGLIAWLSLYAPVVSGALQGARRFGWIAAAALAPGLVRLGLAWPVARAGGDAAAMLGVYAASVAAGLAVGLGPLCRALATSQPERLDLRPFARYFGPVAGGQLVLYVLMNADLIFAPRLLSAPVLSAYGKAAMLARSVLFLPMPLVVAMFPRAVVSARRRMLLQPVAMALGLSAALAAVVTAVPGLALRVMYGVESAVMVRLVRAYVWGVIPLALTGILLQYLWARHRTAGPAAALAPVVAGYVGVLLTAGEGNPIGIILAMVVAGLCALLVLAAEVLRLWRESSAA